MLNVEVTLQFLDNVEVHMSKHSKQHDNQQVVYMIHREMNYSVSRLILFYTDE